MLKMNAGMNQDDVITVVLLKVEIMTTDLVWEAEKRRELGGQIH